MSEYRKKPVVIEARQWDGLQGGATTEILTWIRANGGKAAFHNEEHGRDPANQSWSRAGCESVSTTLEGAMTARIGDWIIKGVKGEILPVQARHLRGDV